jgi:hypothetical protein
MVTLRYFTHSLPVLLVLVSEMLDNDLLSHGYRKTRDRRMKLTTVIHEVLELRTGRRLPSPTRR